LQGLQGLKGNTGATGSQGLQGIQWPAGTGLGTTWANIDRHEWTNQLSWSNVGSFISPPETTNFDIITNNSITPVVDNLLTQANEYDATTSITLRM
jgi:hypothetical protein